MGAQPSLLTSTSEAPPSEAPLEENFQAYQSFFNKNVINDKENEVDESGIQQRLEEDHNDEEEIEKPLGFSLDCKAQWQKWDLGYTTLTTTSSPTPVELTTTAIVGDELYIFIPNGVNPTKYVFNLRNQMLRKERIANSLTTAYTATTVGEKIFIFGLEGGRGKLTVVNTIDNRTSVWNTAIARTGHSTDLVGTRLFIYGGYRAPPSAVNELLLFDTGTMTFSAPSCGGKQPMPRWKHAAAVVGTRMFVFGGQRLEPDKAILNNKIHVLDCQSLSWIQAHTKGKAPPTLMGHSMKAIGVRLFVFGGYIATQLPNKIDEENYFRLWTSCKGIQPNYVLYCFDTVTMSWTHEISVQLAGIAGLTQFPLEYRSGLHSASVDGTNLVITGISLPRLDVHSLDTKGIPFVVVSKNILVNDMKKLLASPEKSFTDLIITSQGDGWSEPLYAHRCIVLSRWPFLRSLVERNKESSLEEPTWECQIKSPFSREIVMKALELVYSDAVAIPPELHDDFVRFVGEYHLDRIQRIDRSWKSDQIVSVATSLETDLARLYSLRDDPDFGFSDFTIRVQDQTFPANKAILWARSSYFGAMLDWSTRSSPTQQLLTSDPSTPPTSSPPSTSRYEVTLEGDITSVIFEDILRYIYTNNVNLTTNNAVELLLAASHYNLDDLSAICMQGIACNLDTENVSTILEACSRMLDLGPLKSACIDFIVSHYDIVTRTHQYQLLDATLRRSVLSFAKR